MKQIQVDFSRPNGKPINPLHGVNSGPMTKVFTYDARDLFREGGFPYARLHDVEYPYGSGEFVDIPCVFRNFDADETDPANYNFKLTDEYLRHIMEVGCRPLFRLGVSIEHAPVKRHIFPPKDYEKWSRICEHIILHYTEGWADGFRWDIQYWEIWNEADGASRNMWQGTPEEFYELYVVSARYLKARFPHLKIGGCGYTRAKNEFIENFFKYISTRKEPVPLDFYSWHIYSAEIGKYLEYARLADDLLQTYGYPNAESVMDEWNYMESWTDQAESYRIMKNHIGAAHCGAVLCAMQSLTDVRVANYFEADVVKEFCGIFDVKDMAIGRIKATLKPTKAFYSFKAFNELYRLGNAVDAVTSGEGIYACAATGEGGCGILAANFSGGDSELTLSVSGWKGSAPVVSLTDETHTAEKLFCVDGGADFKLTIPLKNHSVLYVGPDALRME